MYKVSLIIPIYNVAEYIEQSLLSALNQSFDSIEYILVDDCGTDNSMEIVQRVVDKHFRKKDVFIYRHEQNQGASTARNTGLRNATGRYIYFMDSDDVISQNCIELHYDALIGSDADFTIANTNLFGKKSVHVKKVQSEVQTKQPLESFLDRDWPPSVCNHLYKKELILKNNLFFKEGLLYEDVLWAFQLSCIARKIVYVSQATYDYIIRENSATTSKNSDKKIESMLYIIDKINSYRSSGNIPDSLLLLHQKYINFICLNTALLLLNFTGSCKKKRQYYHRLGVFTKPFVNLYGFIFIMPFCVFNLIIKPLYYFYKMR